MEINTTTALKPPQNEQLRVFLHALLFVAGLSFGFTVGWGGSATLVGQWFGTFKGFIACLGSVIFIMFGSATLDLIHIPWFYADTRMYYRGKAGSYVNSAMMGLFFAAGWGPFRNHRRLFLMI